MTEKRGRGQPKFEPTHDQRSQVKLMKALGIPEDRICKTITNPRTGKPVAPMTLEEDVAPSKDETWGGAKSDGYWNSRHALTNGPLKQLEKHKHTQKSDKRCYVKWPSPARRLQTTKSRLAAEVLRPRFRILRPAAERGERARTDCSQPRGTP
jgi:hypothetical protein